MLKKTLLILVFCLPLFVLNQGGAATIKIATVSPDGSIEVQTLKAVAKEIAKQTQNRVKFKFYPGGVMGNDQAVIRKIRFRQLQGGLVSSSSLASFNPDGQIYAMPFVFKSFAEVDFVRARMDELIISDYYKAGFKVFGLAEGGFAHILSVNPVASVADLQKQKVWSPENDIAALTAIQSYGVKPIPLSIADVRTGLQTGLVDTVAIPPAYAIVLQWHTQVKYITKLPLLYTFGILALENKVFDRLKASDQEIVNTLLVAAFKKIDGHNRQQNEEAMVALADIGLEFVTPSPAKNAEWTAKSDHIAQGILASGKMSPEIVKVLNGHLADYRGAAQK